MRRNGVVGVVGVVVVARRRREGTREWVVVVVVKVWFRGVVWCLAVVGLVVWWGE